eukprot:CAMPEP_0119101024 /NCGR_PEP_ID=MMETSP1180-20130426/156_1 /TAXON_ID=3052 ORGANISM="Chlamydomonas cf sp, Strain CCMP681" /NCGR_SAMPLE_ID=MMETSP1180 /ASSEMBLY_ACC=CAM_ASM_000741 /LENGTH=464 /DNA_ID=CAMNT_0007085039 /DNA_START=71 /DNA_END=1466 /DNA_ORIENTATION=-
MQNRAGDAVAPDEEAILPMPPFNGSQDLLSHLERPTSSLAVMQLASTRIALALAWCATSCVFGIQASILGPTASILASHLGCQESDLGPVIGMGGICTLLGGLPSGWLIDRVPGNRLLAVTLTLQAALYAVIPRIRSIWVLGVVWAGIAFMFNIVNTGLQVLVIWTFGEARVMTQVLSLVSALFGVGGILAPQVVILAVDMGNPLLSYEIIAGATFLMAVALSMLPSPFNPTLAAPSANGQDLAAQSAKGRSRWLILGPALLVIFANVSIELGYAGWIFMYSRSVTAFPDLTAEHLVSMYWLAFTVGRFASAGFASCVSTPVMLLTSMPLAIVGSVWPLLAPSPVSTVASVLLVGLGASCGFPATMALTAQYLSLDGETNGLIATVAGLAATIMPALVPWLAGQAWLRIGWHSLMVVTLGMALLQWVALLQLLLAGRANRKASRLVAADAGLDAPLLSSWHGSE